LSRREIAELHASTLYQSRYGFLPGFIYLSGLDEKLHCPRKESPRKSIPSGAVGIGGTRTGIYSLESPGGWQIIGRTPLELFNAESDQPFIVPNGATIRFFPISKKEFDDWR
jgi:inhibitor of KinA